MTTKDTIIARAIDREVANLEADLKVFDAQREELERRRDELQTELDAVNERLFSHANEVQEAQALIDDLKTEVTTVQERAQLSAPLKRG